MTEARFDETSARWLLISNTYYPAFNRPDVELVTSEIAELHHAEPEAVAADVAYKMPAFTKYFIDHEMTPALPYTRPRTKDGFFRKHEYV